MALLHDTSTVRVLLVEDSVAQARFIEQTLRASTVQTFDVTWAATLAETTGHLAASVYDVVLLDLVLPDSDGILTFEVVHDAHPDVPIIVLSGAGDETTALQAVADGAQDYLAKSTMSPELLTRSIRYSLERHRNLTELRRMALTDELTGVHNRRGFFAFAEKQMAIARRTGTAVTVLFVDVEGLKQMNDTFGHRTGDQALADVGALMQETFRESDLIGRIGGDEFCALLVGDGTVPSSSRPASERFQSAIDEHNERAGRAYRLACTVGAVTKPATESLTVADLLSEADYAMYLIRQQRRAEQNPLVGHACPPRQEA